jgi:hypothetical protein
MPLTRQIQGNSEGATPSGSERINQSPQKWVRPPVLNAVKGFGMRLAAAHVTMVIVLVNGASASAAPSCERLKTLALASTRITSAAIVEAGRFRPPDAKVAAPAVP